LAEFSYDALKISGVKALGVYTCRDPTDKVGRCRLNPVEARVESDGFSA